MTLRSTEMRRLEAQSATLQSKGHKSVLAEAINATRVSRDPRASLQLLLALSKHARKDQKQALDDVRRWIQDRLREEPTVTADRLLLELGWLRRMCVSRLEGAMHGTRE